MEIDAFWSLVERSAQGSVDPIARADWIASALTVVSEDDLLDFQDHLDYQMGRVSSDLAWQAAALIRDGCGDDSFSRFQAWVVGLGRDAVDRVAADPDHLADRPEVQRLAGRDSRDWAEDEWPEWEAFEFVAVHEYERRHGDHTSIYHARPDSPQPVTEPTADEPDDDRELPRLAAMFPDNGPF